MKGISPLIASVLLIAFTVSISMIIMGWFSSFVRTSTSNISAATTEAIGCNSASVNIERVYISGTTGNIIVKNSGFVSLNVSGIIVNTTGGTCSSGSVTLSKGNITNLTMTGCNPTGMGGSSCPNFSRAMVSTSCGGVDDVVTSTSDVSC